MIWRRIIYCLHFGIFTLIVPYILYLMAGAINQLPVIISFGSLNLVGGGLLTGLGLYFMLRAEIDMYRYGGGGTPIPIYNPPKRLITEGIYSCCRNPMYLGTTLEYCGIGLLTNRLTMIPLSLIVLSLAILLYNFYEKPKLSKNMEINIENMPHLRHS